MNRRYKVLPLPSWMTPPPGWEFSRDECRRVMYAACWREALDELESLSRPEVR